VLRQARAYLRPYRLKDPFVGPVREGQALPAMLRGRRADELAVLGPSTPTGWGLAAWLGRNALVAAVAESRAPVVVVK